MFLQSGTSPPLESEVAADLSSSHPKPHPLKQQRQRSCAGHTSSSGGAGGACSDPHLVGNSWGGDSGSGNDDSAELWLQLVAERLALGQARLEGEAAARSWALQVQQLQEQVWDPG